MNNYEAGRTTLCRQDYEAIRNWTRPTNFNMSNAGLHTEAGLEALHNVAKRFQQVVPEVLTATYDPERFHFRHSYSETSNTSIRALATGLFGAAGAQNVVYEDVPERDILLRPFDFCPAYSDATENWNASQEAFRRGPEVEESLQNINRKLGFVGSDQLSFETIFIMWEWCRYELSSTFEFSNSETGDDSIWCAAFSVADHLLMEYYEEIGLFYRFGYGVGMKNK